MSNNKEHIPTTNESKDDSEEQKGSGGLLSPIGDPLGKHPPFLCNDPPMASFPSTPSFNPKYPPSANYLSNNHAGKALNTGLRPIGAPLEKITAPLGDALGGTTRGALGPLLGEKDERSELLGGNNKDSYESRPEKIAGKEQTGQNPLGLDQTGRWGFRDE